MFLVPDVGNEHITELLHDRRNRSPTLEGLSKETRQPMEALVLEECLNEGLTGSRAVKNGRKEEFLLLAKVSNRLLGKEAEEGACHRAPIGAFFSTLEPARLNQRLVVVMRQRHEAAVSFHELTAISNANI